jgi:hypothetical protein
MLAWQYEAGHSRRGRNGMKSVKQHVFVDLDPRAGFYWVELGQPRRRRSQDVTPGTRDGPLCDRGRTVIRP